MESQRDHPLPTNAQPHRPVAGTPAGSRGVDHEAGLRPLREAARKPRHRDPRAVRGARASGHLRRRCAPAEVHQRGAVVDRRRDRRDPTQHRRRARARVAEGATMTAASLTKSQAARRGRVIEAALSLGADGGYDAVQMRDVATTAGVALGTISRYFSSKDHLLAETLVEWAAELGRKVSRKPPKGERVSERVVDVLRRATRGMELEPKLSEAVVTALSSTDPHAARCQREVGEVMNGIIASAFPDDFDAATRDDIVRVLGHVWFSSLVGWVNRWYGINHVGDEVEIAAHLLLDQYD